MTTLDPSALAKLNVWRTPRGEFCTRPGLRNIFAPDAGRSFVGGFSVDNARTGEITHYLLDVVTAGPFDVRLVLRDEDFVAFQTYKYKLNVIPRGFSFARVLDTLLIGSPDLPTLWGNVSGAVIPALPQPSISGQDPIDVPRGIWTSWQGRAVACNGSDMFVSDPVNVQGGDVRSFIGSNQNQRPGAVYGIHESAGGMFLAVTSVGVYGLDASDAAVGVVGADASGWRILSHVSASSYESSCVNRGRLYCLTKDGIIQGDVEDGAEVPLSDPEIPRKYGPPIGAPDFRGARLLSLDEGPAVALDSMDALWRTCKMTQMASWWTSAYAANNFKVHGTLRDVDGRQMLVCENGVFRVEGDFDGDAALADGSAPYSALYGRIAMKDGQDSVLVRSMRARAATTTVGVAVRGSAFEETPPVDLGGLIVGHSSWGDGRWTSTPVGSVEFPLGEDVCTPGFDLSIESVAKGLHCRIAGPDVVLGGDGARPQKTG